MIGEVVGSYRIVAELGAGGMGSVFLAEHTMLGSKAAIKMLRPELSQQTNVVQRFFDEARAATRVADPGIVTVLDFGWHKDGSAFLVMEHLPGETLTRRVRRLGYLPPAVALGLLRQCAMAMSAAHARGIVHRDLKPDNIFIVPDPAVAGERIKVLDFGIAKLLGEGDASHGGTVTGMILGTPGYMSPEQCRGAGNVDHRTDVYALGCVAFYMMCGRPPFDAPTPGDLIAAHLVHQPPVPSSLIAGISPAVDALILRCLAKDAGARFQTMAELVTAIDDTAVGTIPPRGFAVGTQARAGGPVLPGAPTVATGPAAGPVVAATPTTLGAGVGESIEGTPSRGRGGAIGIAIALVAAAVVVIVVTTRGGKHANNGAAGDDRVDAAPIAETTDAAPTPAGRPDAAPIVAAPPDAAPRTVDHGGHDTHKGGAGSGSTKAGSGAKGGAGSGSAKAGSGAKGGAGSGSAKAGSGSGYDPYDVR